MDSQEDKIKSEQIENIKNYEETRDKLINLRTKSYTLESVLRLYIVFGIVIAVLSLLFLGYSFLDIDLTSTQRLALAMAASGISISSMSIITITALKNRRELKSRINRELTLEYIILKYWEDFEQAGRLTLEKLDIKFNQKSPRSIVSALEKNNMISKDMSIDIAFALEVRNSIAHQSEVAPRKEIEQAKIILETAIDQLNISLMEMERKKQAWQANP